MIELEEPSGFAGRGGDACAPVTGQSSIFESLEGEECAVPSPAMSSTTEETSSIGNNSDLSATDDDGENGEVQSAYKGSLDSMEALEEVLPIRRGISNFYNGKSKSFTSLAEATSSVKEIAKPENAYSRRRRNLLAFNHVWDRSKGFTYQRSNGGGGISKRPLISSSRSQLALAVAMSSSESIGSSSEDSYSVGSPPRLPPLHPRSRASHNNLVSIHSRQQDLSPWRCFSVVDLQQCAVPTTGADH